MSSRNMSVAGTFYPFDCSEIKSYIKTFNERLEPQDHKIIARAIISPHAGYVYSGFTANSAYRLIDTSRVKRVIVIGPSHRVYIKGASVALYDNYSSPCGELNIDKEYSQTLMDRYGILSFYPELHNEHSTETQIPFIKHYFSKVEVAEIVYGDINYKDLVPLIKELLEDKENLIVISTDLSHFHDLQTANKKDSICYKSIKEMDIKGFDKGGEACGMIGVKALVEAALSFDLHSEVIDYRTSFDMSNDASSVVGYLSALIY